MRRAGVWWWTAARRDNRPNLLLITIDTLRADHLGAYGATTGATPALDALAAARRPVRSGADRRPADRPFARHDPDRPVSARRTASAATSSSRSGSKYPTLATLLKRRGYQTAAFVGAYPVAAAFGFNQGFDTFDEEFHETSPGEPGRRAPRQRSGRRRAALAGVGRYGDECAAAVLRVAAFLRSARALRSAAAVPRSLRRAVRTTARSPSPTRRSAACSRRCAASGHDARHRRHGARRSRRRARRARRADARGAHLSVDDAVPLMVSGPGVPPGTVVRRASRPSTSLPTALGLLGIDADPALLGRDLRPLMDGRTVPSDPLYGESLFGRLNCHWATLRGWVKDDWKLITGAAPELYNLAEDPGELRNLAPPAAGTRAPHDRRTAARRCSGSRPAAIARSRIAATPEQEERLRSLGYTAGSGGSGPLDDPALPDPRTHVELYDRLQAATAAAGSGAARARSRTCSAITELDPGNPFAFGTLASMAYRYGSLPIAARAFARTLELDPDRPGIRQNYGKLLRELGASRRVRARAANRAGADVGRRLAHAREPGRDARGAEENGRGGDARTPCWRASRRTRRRSARRGRLLLAQKPRAGGAAVLRAGDGDVRSRAVHRAGAPRTCSANRVAGRARRGDRGAASEPGPSVGDGGARARADSRRSARAGRRVSAARRRDPPAPPGRLGSAGRGVRSRRPAGGCRAVPSGGEALTTLSAAEATEITAANADHHQRNGATEVYDRHVGSTGVAKRRGTNGSNRENEHPDRRGVRFPPIRSRSCSSACFAGQPVEPAMQLRSIS